MQSNPFVTRSFSGCKTYVDARADGIKQKLHKNRNNPAKSVLCLQEICSILLNHIEEFLCATSSSPRYIPIFIMRGGLIMQYVLRDLHPDFPSGMVIPHRSSLTDPPKVIYGNVPVVPELNLYILLDVVIASGASVFASIESVRANLGEEKTTEEKIMVAAPFSTEFGIETILRNFPNVMTHTIWCEEKLDHNNKLTSIGFDVGDYAFGGTCARRVQWAKVK